MGQLHTHQIQVETDQELVTVQIGGEGSVPGGFAKLFNRVIDSEAWARLSDAARAAYLPLVRFADNRNQFRVQIGQAALMKYAGLSRSSIKRAMRDLIASRLIVLVEQGGVTPDGRNESNLYQLMVPVARHSDGETGRPREPSGAFDGDSLSAARLAAPAATPRGPLANPQGGRSRTPTRFSPEPPVGSAADLEPVPLGTARGAQRTPGGRSASGPQLRSISEKKDNSIPSPAASRAMLGSTEAPTDVAAFLMENGVEKPIARQLASAYPMQRIVDVVETMQYRRARGKCDNPGGFIRDALVKQWQTPQAVIDARAKAAARARAEAAEAQARLAESTKLADVDADQRRVEQLIDALDDDELELLAREVLKKYDGNTAVLGVLTRKPPRECRLMKMEVAALLRSSLFRY